METIVRACSQRVGVVLGEVVGDARVARVHVAAAQLLGRDVLAGRGLHERRAAQEDRAGLLDDDRLVAHRRHVGAAGRARAHHHRDLGDALRRHARLVEEDAAEVLAVGEDLGLQRQEGAARVDEIDARQPVLERDLLGPQVLLHRQRIVGAALDRRVVGDDQDLAAGDAADAGDQAGARRIAVVEAGGGERRDLEERRARIEQAVDALADRQLALLAMPGVRRRAAAGPGRGQPLPQLADERRHARGVVAKLGGIGASLALHHVHGCRHYREEPQDLGINLAKALKR